MPKSGAWTTVKTDLPFTETWKMIEKQVLVAGG